MRPSFYNIDILASGFFMGKERGIFNAIETQSKIEQLEMCVITASKPVLILYDIIHKYEEKTGAGPKIAATAHVDQITPF